MYFTTSSVNGQMIRDAVTHLFRTAAGSPILSFTASGVTWDVAVSAPLITQADVVTNGATGKTMKFHAQSTTGSSSLGGDIIAAPGTGVSANGRVGVENVDTTTTAPVQGAGDALPALPTEYVSFMINGAVQQIPVY
jgi:hypothetical protein